MKQSDFGLTYPEMILRLIKRYWTTPDKRERRKMYPDIRKFGDLQGIPRPLSINRRVYGSVRDRYVARVAESLKSKRGSMSRGVKDGTGAT